jgi:DNA-binding MarR family transcriptional regulator
MTDTAVTPAAWPAAPAGALGIGPAVGMAERALTRRLAGVLAETGTSALTWYALQRLSTFGTPPSVTAFRNDLRDELDLDEAAASALVDEIVAAGLVAEVDGAAEVAFTKAGAARRGQIRASIAARAGQLTESLEPGDIETTIRTLTAITARAREER